MDSNPTKHQLRLLVKSLVPAKSHLRQLRAAVGHNSVFRELRFVGWCLNSQNAGCTDLEFRYMRKIPLRIALPIAMGLLSAMLMVWDIHNLKIIRSMGMAWDTGAPLWPYQTPDTVLFALNFPAFLVSAVGTYYFDFGIISPMNHAAFFSVIIAWWWLVGLYLDKHSVNMPVHKAQIQAFILYCLAIGLVLLAATQSRSAVRWWWTYSRTLLSVTDLILLRLLTPCLWCFALGLVCFRAARRRMGLRFPPSE